MKRHKDGRHLNFWIPPRALMPLSWSRIALPCASIWLNLVTALNRFREQCSLKKTRNRYHISLTWQVFSQGRRLLTDLIGKGAKIRPRPLNTRRSEAVTVSIFFPLTVLSTTPTTGILYSPQFCSYQETNTASPSNSTIDTYDLTEK